MTDSIRESVLQRIAELLTGCGPGYATPCRTSVFRSRQEALDRAISPALVIEPGESEETTAFSELADQNTFEVDVSVVVRGDPYDQLADPICVRVHALLMADPTLAGLVDRVRRVRTQWRAVEADATAGAVTARYRVTYLSAFNDLTRAPFA